MNAKNGGDRSAWPIRALRRGARGLRRVIDRTLHTARRRRAGERLAGRPTPSEILFICRGNICRSPYAEFAMRQRDLLHERNTVLRSAGFIGPGRPSPPEALSVAARRGVDLDAHRSRLMNTTELRTALVVVMDAQQQEEVAAMASRPRDEILVLGDLDPAPGWRRGILDPWGKPEAVFEEVYERIDRCLVELARHLNRGAGSAGSRA